MQTADRIQTLRYPAAEQVVSSTLQSPKGPASLLPVDDRQERDAEVLARAKRKIAELELKLANLERELPSSIERSRLAGEEEGRRKQAEQLAQTMSESRASIAAAIEAFAEERRKYFRGVEAETVKLALAIARKILHREAQMDAMLLRGAVRSALDRLEETSKVSLRIPPREGPGWQKILAEAPEERRPSLVEDARLRPGECWIESQMGTVELSVEAQLEEIGRGFFDLLDQPLPVAQEGQASGIE